MIDALTATEAGMANDVQRLQIISNNLANVGTAGFKKELGVTRPFLNYLSDGMPSSGAEGAPVSSPQFVRATDFSGGTLKHTGNPLDLGIEGGGFLVVSTATGEAFTRQSSLQLNPAGQLVTLSGNPVLGIGGEIRLTTPTPRIDQTGTVWEGNTAVGQLQVVNVPRPDTLLKMGEGLYQASENTDVLSGEGLRVQQGYTETSNVVSMNEMIKLIETVRHFEASQRLVHGYDEMLDRAINTAAEL